MPSGTVGSEPVNASSPVGRSADPTATVVGDPFGAVGLVADAVGVGLAVAAAGRTVMVTVVVAFGAVPFDAVIVTVNDPGVVGVPVIAPVAPFRVRPAGSPVAV